MMNVVAKCQVRDNHTPRLVTVDERGMSCPEKFIVVVGNDWT